MSSESHSRVRPIWEGIAFRARGLAGRVLQVAQGTRAFSTPISTPQEGEVKPSNTFSKDFFKNGVCAKREGGCAQSVQQIAQGGCTKTGASPKLHRGVPDGRLTLRESVQRSAQEALGIWLKTKSRAGGSRKVRPTLAQPPFAYFLT